MPTQFHVLGIVLLDTRAEGQPGNEFEELKLSHSILAELIKSKLATVVSVRRIPELQFNLS